MKSYNLRKRGVSETVTIGSVALVTRAARFLSSPKAEPLPGFQSLQNQTHATPSLQGCHLKHFSHHHRHFHKAHKNTPKSSFLLSGLVEINTRVQNIWVKEEIGTVQSWLTIGEVSLPLEIELVKGHLAKCFLALCLGE